VAIMVNRVFIYADTTCASLKRNALFKIANALFKK